MGNLAGNLGFQVVAGHWISPVSVAHNTAFTDDAGPSWPAHAYVSNLGKLARLVNLAGVGPVMATTFKATLDEVERFREAQQVVANLGLVPREREGTVNSRGEVGKTDGSPTSLPPPSKLYGR